MRKVVRAEEVSHLWAHQAQDSARTPSENFYFTGPTLYSYGSHFVVAHILPGGRVLWNDASYSNTTSRHQTLARRAMTRQQWDSALRIPSLNSNSVRSIDQALRNGTLSEEARKLTDTVAAHIANLGGKRYGSRPFCEQAHLARSYDRTARELYAAAGKRYPLPEIPEEIPEDKAARAEFIRSFSRRVIRERFEQCAASASRYLHSAANPDGSSLRDLENAKYAAGECDRYCREASGHYAILNPGKKSRRIAQILRDLAPIAAQRESDVRQATRADDLAWLQRFACGAFQSLRRRKTAGRFSVGDLPGYIQMARRKIELHGFEEFVPLVTRLERIQSANAMASSLSHIRQWVLSARSYLPTWPRDALRQYRELIAAARRFHGPYGDFLRQSLTSELMEAETRAEEIAAEIKAKEAENIAAWIRGESNQTPSYDSGTYARIEGDMVVTSRHARVPIEHACRLTRVYSRIVDAGGRDWPDGSGPMVGHYRVNRIGADGSLVIGCHEFTPEEARRLRDLLQGCAACQGVKE